MVSESHSVSRKESASQVGDNRSITQSRSLVEPVSVAVLLKRAPRLQLAKPACVRRLGAQTLEPHPRPASTVFYSQAVFR